MKQVIFSNWNFMRFLRLGLGIAIIVQSVMAGNWTMGILGLLSQQCLYLILAAAEQVDVMPR